MMKTCKELFEGLESTILGNANEPVTGIAYRSDAVQPGDAFFCIVGFTVDGHSFAQDAIDRGAKVIVAERRLYLADATDVTVVIVPDSRSAMAKAACNFYDNPSESFQLVGITGTNGKTTTTYLVEAIARAAGLKTGVIGTVGLRIGDETFGTEHTTPESPDLQKTLAQMRDAGCQVVAMEVSSHALDLKRVYGTKFAVTAFTNLTQDHLDYHHTFEAYFEAKALLFGEDYPAKRVIGADAKWGRELAKRCTAAGDSLLTTGFNEDECIHPKSVEYEIHRTDVDLAIDFDGKAYDEEFSYGLVGKFNVENVMTAYAIGLQLGIDNETIIAALVEHIRVPGRLENVTAGKDSGFAVYVDYAHTPDALEKALSSVLGLCKGRSIVVFGCGGDRDSAKRPIMGNKALSADIAIATSDNPRTEDPDAIIEDIVAGMGAGIRKTPEEIAALDGVKPEGHVYTVIPDRREAIDFACQIARPQDVVLVAGKGHEDYQIIGTTKTHFSDTEEVRRALEAR